MTFVQRSDYETDAQDALTDQFRKDKIKALTAAFSAQVQAIENVCFEILGGRTIDTAEGVQLDGLGALIGEPRQGRTDAVYRLWIKVRVKINLSCGTAEQILEIMSMVTDPGQVLALTEYYPAAFVIDLLDQTDPDVADALNDILQTVKSGGVRADLITSPEEDTTSFIFADATEIASATQGCADTDEENEAGIFKSLSPHKLPAPGALFGFYGNGLFLLHDFNVGASTSPDGRVWTLRTFDNPATFAANAFAYGDGLYVAGGVLSGSGAIQTSADGGVTWISRVSNFSTETVLTLAHDGTSTFVAAGTGGRLSSSPDGINWTSRTSQFGTTNIKKVIFAAGLWVAIGTKKIATSSDGVTWTLRSGAGLGTGAFADIAYGAGVFVTVNNHGEIFSSPDGVTWTQQTSPFGGSDYISRVVYGKGLFIAAGGPDAAGKVARSADGVSWTLCSTSQTARVNDVVTTADIFVVGGGETLTGPAIETSEDGVVWVVRDGGIGAPINTLLASSDRIVAAGLDATNVVTAPAITLSAPVGGALANVLSGA